MPEKVLVTREIPETGLRPLEGFDVTVLSEKIDAEVMDAAGDDLKVVANMAVGYDNVDLEVANERGVVVTNTPEVLNETTADTAFMLMLAAARRLGEAERLLRSGPWYAWGPRQLT